MTNETAIVYLKNLIRDDYRQQKIAINKAIKALEQQSTADAIKEAYDKGFEYGVKEWFETKTKAATWIYDKSIDGYYCSKCKTSHYKVMTPYCANCGAKMKKEKAND